MDKYIDFITEYKFVIAVIVLVTLIIIVGVSSYMDNKKEGMQVNSPLSKFINKEINLKYIKDNKELYLAITPTSSCDNIKHNDCLNNIAILQQSPNKYSRMLLSFNPYNGIPRYSIVSIANEIRNLNCLEDKKICFDDSTDDDVISFELEEKSGRYAIRYRNELVKKNSNGTSEYSFYYLGECDSPDHVCKQSNTTHKRLCVNEDPSKAIYFEIEYASQIKESFESEMYVDDITNTTEPPVNLYSISYSNNNSIDSLKSFQGYDANLFQYAKINNS